MTTNQSSIAKDRVDPSIQLEVLSEYMLRCRRLCVLWMKMAKGCRSETAETMDIAVAYTLERCAEALAKAIRPPVTPNTETETHAKTRTQ